MFLCPVGYFLLLLFLVLVLVLLGLAFLVVLVLLGFGTIVFGLLLLLLFWLFLLVLFLWLLFVVGFLPLLLVIPLVLCLCVLIVVAIFCVCVVPILCFWVSLVGGLVFSSLPLGGIVAFAGSRYGSPFSVGLVVSGVLAAGGSIRVGCARGVDSCVRNLVPASRLVVVSASEFSNLPVSAALAVRTRAVVSSSQCLLAFPSASGVLGKGTGLAITTAIEFSLPVWVAGSICPNGIGWKSYELFGVVGWLHTPLQNRLF